MKYLFLALMPLLFVGCTKNEELKCDSETAKGLFQNIASDLGIKIEYMRAYTTLDDSKENQTVCTAMYKSNDILRETYVNYTLTLTDDSKNVILEVIE